MRWVSIATCAAVAPLLAAASEPVRLQPSSPWVLDYAENSCRLVRIFGEGKTRTFLQLESDAPGNLDMLAEGKTLRTSSEEVAARFIPAGVKTFKGRPAITTKSGDPAILWSQVNLLPDDVIDALVKLQDERRGNPGIRPAPATPEQRDYLRVQRHDFAVKSTELEIQTTPNHPVVLETGSIGDAIDAFDKCSRNSLADWGVDPAVEDKIVRPVWPIYPINWLSADDYPKNALSRGQESEVVVRLLVDASGKPTKCTGLSHYNDPEFNRVTCDKIMKRAMFAPAELADGTKVSSYVTQRVNWRVGR